VTCSKQVRPPLGGRSPANSSEQSHGAAGDLVGLSEDDGRRSEGLPLSLSRKLNLGSGREESMRRSLHDPKPGAGYPTFEASRPKWWQVPAAVQVSAAKNISFVRNRFVALGQVRLGIATTRTPTRSASAWGRTRSRSRATCLHPRTRTRRRLRHRHVAEGAPRGLPPAVGLHSARKKRDHAFRTDGLSRCPDARV
jgi:hypothetical protein